jgi:citrate synthase
MQDIDILYWAISIVFCLGLLFAILLWCRSWRREEREIHTRQLQQLAREVRRLRDAVETLDTSVASIQTADEQFSQQLDTLRDTVRDIKRSTPVLSTAPKLSAPIQRVETPEPAPDDSDDRYAQARSRLQSGKDPVEVARLLDLGTAEVAMIARMLKNSDATL